MIDEKQQLDEKIKNLIEFADEPTCKTLPAIDREHLTHQLDYMQGYSETLAKRIAAFS